MVKKENGRRIGFWVRLHPTVFFHRDIRDSRKYDTFRGTQAGLFINLLGKGLTQEINGDGGSIRWAPGPTLINCTCKNRLGFSLLPFTLKTGSEIHSAFACSHRPPWLPDLFKPRGCRGNNWAQYTRPEDWNDARRTGRTSRDRMCHWPWKQNIGNYKYHFTKSFIFFLYKIRKILNIQWSSWQLFGDQNRALLLIDAIVL